MGMATHASGAASICYAQSAYHDLAPSSHVRAASRP